MPSLREIRALNSSPSTSPVSPLSMARGDKNQPGTDSQRLISELTTFSLAVFATQTEIAGISSAVAEYLAWVRKAARGSPRENYEGVLETLETRIRELQEIAQTRHQAAWKQMVTVLEKLEGVAPQLSVFERELVLRTAEKAHFFQAEYDICVPMPEQKAKM